MEAGTDAAERNLGARIGALRSAAAERPAFTFGVIVALVALVLIIGEGLQPFGQTTVNGLVSGSSIALGAVGLTLVYGILKLVNFAHGDMLTFGAYIGFLFNVTIGMPFAIALLVAFAATAVVGVFLELAMWRPLRRRSAGMLQLLLTAIGLAFVLRNSVQLVAGTSPKALAVDRTTSLTFIDLSVGRTQLIVLVLAIGVLIGVALMLRYTSLGRQMRALSDNFDLAETTGIDTNRVVVLTWILAAGLAGLAGLLLVASQGSLTPNTGFFLLLPMFAAVILGGIGNAYGALVGGLVIGLSQEWSTLLLDFRWKVAVSFAILILVLVFRPQGIFGRERTL